MEKTRIVLYIGMVYNVICTFISMIVIDQSRIIENFGKVSLVIGLSFSLWYIILILMRNADNK